MKEFKVKAITLLLLGAAAVALAPSKSFAEPSPSASTTSNVASQTEHGSESASADAATASTHRSPHQDENLESATPGKTGEVLLETQTDAEFESSIAKQINVKSEDEDN